MTLETIDHCPICTCGTFKKKFDCYDYTSSNESFTIISCINCSLLITSPRPSEEAIGKYYDSPLYISHSKEAKTLVDKVYFFIRQISIRKKERIILNFSKKGKLLDIGSGTGAFIKYLKTRNWETFGVEPSAKVNPNHVDNGQNVVKKIDEVSKSDFQAITLWHVLEHIYKLEETLQKIRNLLNQDGTIFIAVPNHNSYDATYYQTKWAAYDVPRHLWHFNRSCMNNLLQKNNLKLITVIPMKFDSFYVSLLSERYKNPKASIIIHIAKAFLVGLSSNWRARKTGNFSSLIYVAKKA